MPPFVPRKRHHSPSPTPLPLSKTKPTSKHSKLTLFDTVDAPAAEQKSLEENRKFLDDLNDDESSLSEADSDEFEDVPRAKRLKPSPPDHSDEDDDDDDDDDGEQMDWEDAIQQGPSLQDKSADPEELITDVSISMNDAGGYVQPAPSASITKKGPSKRERQTRIQTHCLHVQALMWHNTVRNSWLNDAKVQKTLVDGLPDGVKREFQKWKEDMGLLSKEELEAKKKQAAAARAKSRKGRKSKPDVGRDWHFAAEHAEQGNVNMSGGDPLLRLLRVLTAYWRKRFVVTAPGLRKQGYKPLRRLRDEIKAWEKDSNDSEECGERIEALRDFRNLARKCEGSRDVGAQLFVALLRGLGLETRMVANLQPSGFGWSKSEDANAKKAKKENEKATQSELESANHGVVGNERTQGPNAFEKSKISNGPSKISNGSSKISNGPLKNEQLTNKSTRGNKLKPINLDDSDSPLSSALSEDEPDDEMSDGLSIVDITPSAPTKKPTKKFDRDLAFPNYWTEVCSPVSNKFYPVDPVVLSTIASSDELLQTFEPRGKKAENAKQVVCYTIAFAADATAKDVTVRYLKKHQLPGKTKGMRMPVEKVPIYNRKGKVRRYEEYDWFRTLMSIYDRPEAQRTAADDLEEQTDLKPFKPIKEAKEAEKESLQWYKQSAEYVLEQHLRREEALRPGAKPIKTFTAGKGDKAKDYSVYRRSEVATCKTVESWHKEGRAIKIGEQPMKYVPMRAVTLIRKREIEDAQRETGEKLKQGLYSEDQTDWIIPPPIEDGIIPKNAFGNMDVYVPTMVPQGAVHLPLKGSAKICRKLGIDYAEACTGFEFGKQRAVPILTGVVVTEENEKLVRDAWRADQMEQRRKEDTKRTELSLRWWRKMLLGLRVLERMRTEYAISGHGTDEANPFVLKANREGQATAMSNQDNVHDGASDEVGGGGFFLPGHEEEPHQRNGASAYLDDVPEGVESPDDGSGGFLVADGNDDDDDDDDEGGGFLKENTDDSIKGLHIPVAPVSLQSMQNPVDKASGSTKGNRARVEIIPAQRVSRAGISVVKSPQQKSNTAKKPVKSKAKLKRKAVPPVDDGNSSVSDLPDARKDESEEASDDLSDSDSSLTPPPSPSTKRHVSPQVLIQPNRPPSKPSRNSRGTKKSTPLKSQYFDNDPPHTHDTVRENSEDESEIEVVKPRRTTARTRGQR